jgi:hypothetical protein
MSTAVLGKDMILAWRSLAIEGKHTTEKKRKAIAVLIARNFPIRSLQKISGIKPAGTRASGCGAL